MSPEHPCYSHKSTCDWCRVCIRGECCDGDLEDEPSRQTVDAIGKPLVSTGR